MTECRFRHVGVVVDDLDAARARLSALLHIDWDPVKEIEVGTRDADGNEEVVVLRICLSTAEPGFELIEEAPGTPWVCNGHSNLHHVSFTSSDVGADSEALAGAGCPLEIAIGAPTTSVPIAVYHRDPMGVRIERSAVDIGRPGG